MADIYSKQKRSLIMSAIRSQGNKATELVVVSLLRRNGIHGWRRHLPLPGRPDFTFARQRVVVFVDGCFWHGCPIHFKMPKSNCTFWSQRIQTNMRRDRRVGRHLRALGWSVVKVWQHDLRGSSPTFLSRLRRALQRQGGQIEGAPKVDR
jgi:DNA mismatch endonuclease (patch repair protein)